MANNINEQLEQTILSSIKEGRWLADDWENAGIRSEPNFDPLLLQLLQRLKDGEPLVIEDENALDLMAEEISDALNALKSGYGDLAMRVDTSEHLIFDMDWERLRQLAERWKRFQSLRKHSQDLQAAIRQLNLTIRRV